MSSIPANATINAPIYNLWIGFGATVFMASFNLQAHPIIRAICAVYFTTAAVYTGMAIRRANRAEKRAKEENRRHCW
jgi:hypothetical protein